MKTIKITLPVLAVFFGLAAVVTTAAIGKQSHSAGDPHWTYSDAPSGTLDQNNYTLYNGDLATLCQQEEDICGVIAPVDPASDPNNPKPDLNDPGLQQRITEENPDGGDVFLLPGM